MSNPKKQQKRGFIYVKKQKEFFTFCFLFNYQNLGEAKVKNKNDLRSKKRLFKNVKILLLKEVFTKLYVLFKKKNLLETV